MEIEQALVAGNLWGCPVDILDRLLQLRRGMEGGITLDEWREKDTALREGLPAVDEDEVTAFQTEVLVDTSLDPSDDAANQLIGRLSVLVHPAPTDKELWDELSELARERDIPGSRRRHREEFDRRLDEAKQRRRERIVRWLIRPESEVDSVTGLPWSQIACYRVVEHSQLGPVPQYVDAARKLARAVALPTELQRADLVADSAIGTGLDTAMADLKQNRLTWFLQLVGESAEDDEGLQPVMADLLSIWADQRVQKLLIEETALGWPPPYDRNS